MNKHSRREFVLRSAAGVLAAGTGSMLTRHAAAADKPTDMTIARWAGSKALTPGQIDQIAARLTEQAIQGLGGLKRFVSRGDMVWVKPNIAWDRAPHLAATTHPEVVATLVRLCFAAGAKTVKVGDNPCDIADKTYQTSGIAAAAKRARAQVVYLDRTRFRSTSIGGERVKSLLLYPELMDCDLVVNVPIVKHHVLATATLCMKNYMGVMDNRRPFHQALPVCITDLTRYMKPRICVLDGVRILTRHGPKGGNPEDVQLKMTVAAGTDIVALDAFGAELMGKRPEEIGTIVKGQEAGLGKMGYRSLALREISVS